MKMNAIVMFCKALVLLTVMTSQVKGQVSCDPYNFTGHLDVVFIMDRSSNITEQEFDATKTLLYQVVRKAIAIGPSSDSAQEYSRLAVITYAKAVTSRRALDLFKDNQVFECELFAPGGLWEKNVSYHGNPLKAGEGLLGALKDASALFSSKDGRQGQRRLLVLATDADEALVSELQIQTESMKTNLDVQVFGIGIGAAHKDHTMKLILDELESSCNVMGFTDWAAVFDTVNISTVLSTNKKVKLDKYRPISHPELCCSLCEDTAARCECDEFSVAGQSLKKRCTTDNSQSACQQPIVKARENSNEAFSDEALWIILPTAFGAVNVILIVLAVVVLIMWRRQCKRYMKRRRVRRAQPPRTPIAEETKDTRTGNAMPVSANRPTTRPAPPQIPSEVYANVDEEPPSNTTRGLRPPMPLPAEPPDHIYQPDSAYGGSLPGDPEPDSQEDPGIYENTTPDQTKATPRVKGSGKKKEQWRDSFVGNLAKHLSVFKAQSQGAEASAAAAPSTSTGNARGRSQPPEVPDGKKKWWKPRREQKYVNEEEIDRIRRNKMTNV